MTGTLITVAATGAESDKAQVPALPVTLDELTETAVRCQSAGAAVTVTVAKGRPVTGNEELVRRAAQAAEIAQRPPMTPAEARAFLCIP